MPVSHALHQPDTDNELAALIDFVSRPATKSEDLLNAVIPVQSAWVDNYISEVGSPHSAAANVFLWRNAQLGIVSAHAYSYQWFANTIANPTGCLMGHRWSFERMNSLSTAPARGTVFQQNLDLDPFTLSLTQLDSILDVSTAYPNLVTARVLGAVTASGSSILNGIQHAGDFVENMAESIGAVPSGQPVFVGSANSTSAYYIPPGASSPQGFWDLNFSLQKSASPLAGASQRQNATGPANAGGEDTNGSIYAWIPVSVPRDAVGVSFEYRLDGAGTNEFFTMGITNENFYMLEAKIVEDGMWNGSSVIPVYSVVPIAP